MSEDIMLITCLHILTISLLSYLDYLSFGAICACICASALMMMFVAKKNGIK